MTDSTDNLQPQVQKETKYTLQEISQHCSEGDLWIVFQGKVCDVSQFKHPGGLSALQRNAGTDATQKMLLIESHLNKLPRINELVEKYVIGELANN